MQPANDSSANHLETARRVLEQNRDKPGALLPILHSLQNQLGFVPPVTVPLIAKALQQTVAEIKGVISFYHHFRSTPPGLNQLQICRAEACQARGSQQLEQHAKQRLGIDFHQTTNDQEFSLDPVYCLGNCACGPSVRVGDEVIGRVDPQRFDALIDQLTSHPVEVK